MISANATNRSTWIGSAILASLIAAPAAAQVNYSESFDSGANGWTITSPSGGYYNNTTACGGSGGALRYNLWSSGHTGTFASPQVGTSMGGAMTIDFDYKVAVWSANVVGASAPFGSLSVEYSDSASGPWNVIGTFADEAQTGSCLPKSFGFNPPAGPLFVRIVGVRTGGDNYWNIDNVVVTEAVGPCAGTPTPGDTIAPAVGVCPGATFSLSLQNPTIGSGVDYQWYASDVSNTGPWNPVGGSTATLMTSQLTTSWYYCDVTCTAGPATGSSNVVQVDMNSGANPEGFEDGSLTANCWSDAGGAQVTQLSAASAFGVGSGSAKFNFWSWSAGNTALLTSTEFAPVAGGELVYFDVAGTMWSGSTTSIDFVALEESNDGGANWTTVVTMDNSPTGVLRTAAPGGEFTPTASQWASLAYPLSAGTNRVRFAALAGFGNNVYIDNVSVGVMPSARHTNYGAGCGMSMTASPAPIAGTTFSYDLPDVPLACPSPDPVFHFGFVIVSFDQNFAGADLPTLGFDSPGCNLYVNSLDVLLAYVDVVPTQTVPLTIPAGAPAGALLYSQAVALLCPAAPNNAGLVLSNGVRSYINTY